MKKHKLISALCASAVCLLLAATAALAQGNPGSTGPTPTPNAPTAVPIDGGASLLLASGVAYGLKKIRDRRKAR